SGGGGEGRLSRGFQRRDTCRAPSCSEARLLFKLAARRTVPPRTAMGPGAKGAIRSPVSVTDRASMSASWRRVVVKLSGEALMGSASHGLDGPTVARIAQDLAGTARLGVEIAVVVGGGNFFRGIQGAEKG